MSKSIKIRIPEKIKIGSLEYKIKFSPDIFTDDKFWGDTHRRLSQISIATQISSQERDVTLLHELMELIKINYSITIEHTDIDRVASGLAEFLFDNLGIEFDWSSIGGD